MFQSGCAGGIRCDMYWSVDVFVIYCARDYMKLSEFYFDHDPCAQETLPGKIEGI